MYSVSMIFQLNNTENHSYLRYPIDLLVKTESRANLFKFVFIRNTIFNIHNKPLESNNSIKEIKLEE
ncbi:unnamed protein product [Schistosoma mattheei]|uniref:Uncharacterized protein n=1 Tax=Schistosoma mattheei TaxID=31246 RepID=A0AA85B8M0_9TREM|nr:unnamed protein product [Schistosoma mattheei]